jgi:hypothetical protein
MACQLRRCRPRAQATDKRLRSATCRIKMKVCELQGQHVRGYVHPLRIWVFHPVIACVMFVVCDRLQQVIHPPACTQTRARVEHQPPQSCEAARHAHTITNGWGGAAACSSVSPAVGRSPALSDDSSARSVGHPRPLSVTTVTAAVTNTAARRDGVGHVAVSRYLTHQRRRSPQRQQAQAAHPSAALCGSLRA